MKLLVIEDEKSLANNIKKGLEQENFNVDVAYNGQDGFYMASNYDYQAIITDLMLPEKSGLEICKDLKKHNINTPILMLTAKSQLEDKLLGFKIGADDYLTKPFSFEELIARVKALIKRSTNNHNFIYECNDLKVDLNALTVTRQNTKINLSKTEFKLLEFLIINKNNILTKEKIITNVWPYDNEILTNTVEQYIGYLRNKIDKPFKNIQNFKPLLITVRGYGYKIQE